MTRHLTILIIILGSVMALSQSLPLPMSEMQTLMFITEAYGTSATIINPAGLARRQADDGVYANYNFAQDNKVNNTNFSFSMGNIGFGYQNFLFDENTNSSELRVYRIGLAIGGKVFSFGSSNKVIETQTSGAMERVFSLDAGFIFQPIGWLTLAGYGRDLDEPLIGGFQYKREYTAGISINMPQNVVRLLFEGNWNDSIIYFADADFKAAVAISPISEHEFDIVIGGIRNLHDDEQYFAMLRLPLWGGIQATGAVRVNQDWKTQSYFTALHFPIQTITF